MKFKTTEKAIKANYSKIIKVGYCNLQHLLQYETPMAYTCGLSGWKADIYNIEGTLIVTGYQPFGNITGNYDLYQKYEKKAEKILYSDKNFSYKVKKNRLNKLINQFIEEVTK